jgi:hypothetical protein
VAASLAAIDQTIGEPLLREFGYRVIGRDRLFPLFELGAPENPEGGPKSPPGTS